MSIKISDMTSATTPLSGSELIEIVQGGENRKVAASSLSAAGTREKLSEARTYYVRTDGSDSNNGLANTAGGAFLTIQQAINVVADTLDLNGYDLTIQVADGTYTGTVVMRQVIGRDSTGFPRITVQGNSGTPSNVVISVTSNSAFTNSVGGTILNTKDMKVSTTTSGNCLVARNAAQIQFTNLDFGACAGNHIDSQTYGYITSTGNYTISGGAAAHIFTGTSGAISTANRTVTITGTPAFSTAYVAENLLGVVLCQGCTFSGSATGVRYNISMNAVCYTNGGGSTYLPGNSAGSAATGAQYI